ncbi:MAG TPA: hypothetical protein VE690_12715 [Rhodopila sp.]|nr:hypothetical protein [Rhodopila sp.]
MLFSFRGTTGDMILYLNKTPDVEFRLGFADFKATLAHQITPWVLSRSSNGAQPKCPSETKCVESGACR